LRRAVYLDPRHEQALLHLAFLRARRGDEAEAERLRRRATRAAARTGGDAR
jgi:chemotaxis protein methyltransferase WspC